LLKWSINHLPEIGQMIEDIRAQAKLRFGCVSSSTSNISCCSIYREKKSKSKSTLNYFKFLPWLICFGLVNFADVAHRWPVWVDVIDWDANILLNKS
jgi:hypothetical protein